MSGNSNRTTPLVKIRIGKGAGNCPFFIASNCLNAILFCILRLWGMLRSDCIRHFLFFTLCFHLLPAQPRINLGISAGATVTKPTVTNKAGDGKVSPGIAQNVCFLVAYKLKNNLIAEAGAGYLFNKYKVEFGGAELINVSGRAFFPARISWQKPLRGNKFVNLAGGAAIQTAFANAAIDAGLTDTVRNLIINELILVRTFPFAHMEAGYGLTTKKGKKHQLCLQFFYGFKKQLSGFAYHFNDPSSVFRYMGKNHFASLQYTFWFVRYERDDQ
jgi:hypothetical protein